MYQQLFLRLGFAWTVRIAGFVTLALCAFAIFAVSSNLGEPVQRGPWFELRMFRDTQFVLVVIASIFVCLGMFMHIPSSAHALTASQVSSFHSSTLSTTRPHTAYHPKWPSTSCQ